MNKRSLPLRLVRRLRTEALRAPRRVLRLVYGFDSWHEWPAVARPYVRDIARYLNSRPAAQRESVLEIGAGLGDILRRLRYGQRLGLDQEDAVVRAARLVSALTRDGTRFAVSHFPDDAIAGRFDAVILVNWIHSVPPDVLRSNLRRVVDENVRQGGVVVLDLVDGSGYPYHHSADFLADGLPVTVDVIASYDDGRRIVVFESA